MNEIDYGNFLEELVERINYVLDDDDMLAKIEENTKLGLGPITRDVERTMKSEIDNFLQGWGFELLSH